MKKLPSLLALLVGVAAALPAHAAVPASTSPSGTPDYIAAAFGGYDFDKDGNRDSVDYRLEYQWGASHVPMMNHDWGSLDRWFQLHPVAGFEGNGNGMTYFNGGLNLDVPVVSNLIFTWGETVGWYGHGDDHQTLGSPFEMRSQLELGWKFDNDMRLSAYISHLSNVDTGDRNPGAEVLGGYLRVPVGWLAHR